MSAPAASASAKNLYKQWHQFKHSDEMEVTIPDLPPKAKRVRLGPSTRIDYLSNKWNSDEDVYYYHDVERNPAILYTDAKGNYWLFGYIRITKAGIDDWKKTNKEIYKKPDVKKGVVKLGILQQIKYRDDATGKIHVLDFNDRFFVGNTDKDFCYITTPMKVNPSELDAFLSSPRNITMLERSLAQHYRNNPSDPAAARAFAGDVIKSISTATFATGMASVIIGTLLSQWALVTYRKSKAPPLPPPPKWVARQTRALQGSGVKDKDEIARRVQTLWKEKDAQTKSAVYDEEFAKGKANPEDTTDLWTWGVMGHEDAVAGRPMNPPAEPAMLARQAYFDGYRQVSESYSDEANPMLARRRPVEVLKDEGFFAYSGASGDLFRHAKVPGWRVSTFWGTYAKIQKKDKIGRAVQWRTVRTYGERDGSRMWSHLLEAQFEVDIRELKSTGTLTEANPTTPADYAEAFDGEREAILDYTGMIAKSDDPRERAVLQHILAEESEHFIELMDLYVNHPGRKNPGGLIGAGTPGWEHWRDFQERLTHKSEDELRGIVTDCRMVLEGWRDHPQAGKYLDQIHYATMELRKRGGRWRNPSPEREAFDRKMYAGGRRFPCPTCGQPFLTAEQKRQGYQCDRCADKEEGVGLYGRANPDPVEPVVAPPMPEGYE